MGATSRLPSIYQNHCTVALALLLMKTPTCKLTFHYLLLRSQSAQLHHLVEHLVLLWTTYPKPRITLTAEANDLINRGMADNYDHEPEHSAMGEEAAAESDVPLLLKAKVSAPPLGTSSQASVEEMETSP